jgi:aspartate/methionine/tyrosine aminotransferase
MRRFEARNAHFDRLVNYPGLMWMGQNTNHLPAHPGVRAALERAIGEEEFHVYAPPVGLEELRTGILEDLGLPAMTTIVSDGAVSALYHVCHTLLRPGDALLTTNPTWSWPVAFAHSVGAEVVQVPIYGDEFGYRLAPERLRAAITDKTRIVYLVDPNNPLGVACSLNEIKAIATICRDADAYLVHDCTYRDFAYEHYLAARYYPERTITVWSFSKWLGFAGLRVASLTGNTDLIETLAAAPPNNLGSSIVAQRGAIAGLKVKRIWFPGILAATRANQALVRDTVAAIPGLRIPVYPSHGNFLVIETDGAEVRPAALCRVLARDGILIRQGSYHTMEFGDRFVKISLSVPRKWVEAFCERLPAAIDEARTSTNDDPLF